MLTTKRTLISSAASIVFLSFAAPVFSQTCADYPMNVGTSRVSRYDGGLKISFTANAPLKVDSTTVRDLAWRRARARAYAKLTNLISVDLAASCRGGEKGAITETFSNGEEVFTTEDSFEELCDFVRDAERKGVQGVIEAGRCATPAGQGGEVRVTVGISTETIASAQTIGNTSNQSPTPTVDSKAPTNTNNFNPQPTGYSGYSDDW